jgi:nitrate reductase NapAB chaperone NapD
MEAYRIHMARAIDLSQVDLVLSVTDSLKKMQGLEVHNEGVDGRIIVTVESPKYREVADILMSIRDIEGVLSSELVYQYSDGDKPYVDDNKEKYSDGAKAGDGDRANSGSFPKL